MSIFGALIVAMVGVSWTFQYGCGPFIKPETATEPARPYTPEEVQQIVEKVAPLVDAGVGAAGQPLWVPYVDLIIRLAAFVFAWYQKRELEKIVPVPASPT